MSQYNPSDPEHRQEQRDAGIPPPAHALHTDPNYKAKEAGTFDASRKREEAHDAGFEPPNRTLKDDADFKA